MTQNVTIVEVGPRDGLQNEPVFLPTDTKIELISRLAACRFARIEATAFVSPRWVPQMADHEAVMRALPEIAGLRYSVLVPNLKGAEAAIAAGARELAVFTAASESFCARNTNCTIAESLARFEPVLALAAKHGIPVRGYVSCVTDCPYEGAIAPEAVRQVVNRLRDMGCYEIALGETLGRATPERVGAMLDTVLASIPASLLAGHYHDTHGYALGSIELSWRRGLRVFDGAVGGLGGCPYAPGASGNVASEAVVRLFDRLGVQTGIDLGKLGETAAWIEGQRVIAFCENKRI
jgi:hydroxymethylglutaryl-CoA lyase